MGSSHRFMPNLRDDTFDPLFRKWLKPSGYLIAPNRIGQSARDLARGVQAQGLALYADNGHFAWIGEVSKHFAARSVSLLADIRAWEAKLGRCARRGELSAELKGRAQKLAEAVRAACGDKSKQCSGLLEEQLALEPSHLIGVESITMAVWLALSLEPEYLSYPPSAFKRMNEQTARRAVSVRETLSTRYAHRYYPVASAVSYDTAFAAGVVFAKHGIDRIAMGFGAYMADDHYTDHVFVRGRCITLPGLMPNRYVRTALTTKGFWDGYKSEAGRPPVAFHFLGLGAPIMMSIVSLVAHGTRELTFDATSPIKDAVEGTLYSSKPALLKVRTRKVALRLASSEEHWSCPCSFCRWFVDKYPFDYAKGRAFYRKHQPTQINQPDLAPGGGLYEAYPLLSEPRTSELRQHLDFARTGHNHWVIHELMEALDEHSHSKKELAAFVDGIVTRYEKGTSSQHFAEAVRFAHELAVGHVGV